MARLQFPERRSPQPFLVCPSLPLARLKRAAYNGPIIRAYDEIVEFIAAATTPESVAQFEPSQRTKDHVADLIHKEKTAGLTPEKLCDLDHFLKIEHLMRLAKARARTLCSQ